MCRTRSFFLATVIGAVFVLPVSAEEPRFEYGPVGGDWKVLTGMRSSDSLVSESGGIAVTDGTQRVFWGNGYKVGPGGDGAQLSVGGLNRPRRSAAESENSIGPEHRRHYASITCVETTFHGLPATRCEGVLVNKRHHQVWMDVEVDPQAPRTLLITWEIIVPGDSNFAAATQRLEALLSTFRIVTDAPPASVWKAEIRIPRNLEPGDVLSPSVLVTDQNGREPTESIQVRWLINGKWASSITWDGSRTELEVQVSVEHQAVVAKAVVPAWQPPPKPQAPTAPSPSSPKPPIDPATPAEPDPSATSKPGTQGDDDKVPGLGGAAGLPGPRSMGEALISIIGPAGLGLLGALMSGLLGGGGTTPTQAPTTPDPPTPKPPSTKSPKRRKRTAKEVEKIVKQGEKAQREAGEAGGVIGLISKTLTNAKSELADAAKTIGKVVVQVGEAAAGAARQLASDPNAAVEKIAKITGKIREGAKQVAEATKGAANEGLRIAKEAYNDPQAALQKLKHGAKGLYTSLKNFLTDPKKIWEAVKEWTGVNNFGNALDPNRSLLERVGQVGIGVMKLYGTLTTAGAVATKVKSGASVVIKGAKRLLAKPPSRAEMKLLAKKFVERDQAQANPRRKSVGHPAGRRSRRSIRIHRQGTEVHRACRPQARRPDSRPAARRGGAKAHRTREGSSQTRNAQSKNRQQARHHVGLFRRCDRRRRLQTTDHAEATSRYGFRDLVQTAGPRRAEDAGVQGSGIEATQPGAQG